MKKIFTSRTFILLAGLVAILTMTVVASSLGSLQFKSGTDFSVESDNGGQTVAVGRMDIPWAMMVYLAVAILVVLTAITLIIMPPKQRRKFLVAMAIFITILIIAAIVITLGGDAGPLPETVYTPTVAPVYDEAVTTPLPTVVPSEFPEPQVDPRISYFVALIVCVALALVAWFLLIRRRQASLPSIESIAWQAVVELQAGGDWSRTVEGAYLRMVDTVRQRRGLKRSKDLTPAEFAIILEKIGLPVGAVHRLTGLFERVRYGGRGPSSGDVEEAVACLTEIVNACQEIKA